MRVPLVTLAASCFVATMVILAVALKLSRKLDETDELLDDVIRDYFTLLAENMAMRGATPPANGPRHLRLVEGDDA
jgi:hypothetical protein